MLLKKAIWLAVVLYVVTCVVHWIIALALGVDVWGGAPISNLHWTLIILALIVLMVVFSLWYFKDKLVTASAKEGLWFGLTVFIVGWMIDSFLFALLYILNVVGADMLAYYRDPLLWVALAAMILTPIVAGAWVREEGVKVIKKGKKK